LEYRNQLPGLCLGAIYFSTHKDLGSEYIFLNYPVFYTKIKGLDEKSRARDKRMVE
jgi:hypothetical protein